MTNYINSLININNFADIFILLFCSSFIIDPNIDKITANIIYFLLIYSLLSFTNTFSLFDLITHTTFIYVYFIFTKTFAKKNYFFLLLFFIFSLINKYYKNKNKSIDLMNEDFENKIISINGNNKIIIFVSLFIFGISLLTLAADCTKKYNHYGGNFDIDKYLFYN